MKSEEAAAQQADQWNTAERLRAALVRLVDQVAENVAFPVDSELGEAMSNARRVLLN